MPDLPLLKEIQTFGECGERATCARLQSPTVEDLLIVSKGIFSHWDQIQFSRWRRKVLQSSQSAVSRSNRCLQVTNERTMCLGSTHLWSNLLKSLLICNILASLYWFLSLLLPFTIMWTTFWCHTIFFGTKKKKKVKAFLGGCFYFSDIYNSFSGKKYNLMAQDFKQPPSP